jgi:hypothetical protein
VPINLLSGVQQLVADRVPHCTFYKLQRAVYLRSSLGVVGEIDQTNDQGYKDYRGNAVSSYTYHDRNPTTSDYRTNNIFHLARGSI